MGLVKREIDGLYCMAGVAWRFSAVFFSKTVSFVATGLERPYDAEI